MKEVAPGVRQFRFLWPNAFNAYYLEGDGEGVVIDASTRWSWPAMKRQLKGRHVTGMLLTHAHPDHQGCAAKICRTWNVPLAVHERDADSAEGSAPLVRQNPAWELVGNLVWAGPRPGRKATCRWGPRRRLHGSSHARPYRRPNRSLS